MNQAALGVGDVVGAVQAAAADHLPGFVDLIQIAVNPPQLRVVRLPKGRAEFGQVIGIPRIVLIQQRDQLPLGMDDPVIPGRRLSSIGFAQERDRVRERHPFHDRGTIVGRAIVHDDHLIRRQYLAEDTRERLFDVGRPVIERDHSRDRQWVRWHTCPSSTVPEREGQASLSPDV